MKISIIFLIIFCSLYDFGKTDNIQITIYNTYRCESQRSCDNLYYIDLYSYYDKEIKISISFFSLSDNIVVQNILYDVASNRYNTPYKQKKYKSKKIDNGFYYEFEIDIQATERYFIFKRDTSNYSYPITVQLLRIEEIKDSGWDTFRIIFLILFIFIFILIVICIIKCFRKCDYCECCFCIDNMDVGYILGICCCCCTCCSEESKDALIRFK